jgi:branched-subunit amino acid transport protein
MDRTLTIWLVTLVVGALNFASRVSFIAWFARHDMPAPLERALRHVPVAMLTAIVIPALVFVAPGLPAFGPDNAKLVAGIAAGAAAWWRKSTLLTIAVGMVTLWAVRHLVG